jgi:EAL domain-containing protein (putative c-di-GMP-specific phosphodiesterase class I)
MTPAEFLALTQRLAGAFVLIGGGGEVMAANTAATNLLGVEPSELARRGLSDLTGLSGEETRAALQRCGARSDPDPVAGLHLAGVGGAATLWEAIPLDRTGRAAGQVVLKAREGSTSKSADGTETEVAGTEFIRQALAAERLALAFQPIRRVVGGELLGYEVLVRLKGHDAIVLAEDFVPQAEVGGLMPDIDAWVVERSLALVDQAHREGRELRLAINLSGASLGDAGVRSLVAERCGALEDPSTVTFEITETAAVARLDEAAAFMASIRCLGARFALDDFGSGLSSFAYLKGLPVDVIKIDSLFIRNIGTDAADKAMVSSISSMAKALGKTTIAEGVEDAGALATLGSLGVDGVQGRYVGDGRALEDWEPLYV